jgi:hypothetical protein
MIRFAVCGAFYSSGGHAFGFRDLQAERRHLPETQPLSIRTDECFVYPTVDALESLMGGSETGMASGGSDVAQAQAQARAQSR